ncbi:metallo-beta-lactamase domain-containing protein, partial [Toxoplasma gondii MAS]
GKVLIPVFAVGRAQELCMLLENYWERMHLRFPIYFAGGMTERANAYYRLYVHWSKADANVDADPEDALRTAFSFPHILPFQSSLLSAPTPLVLLATPGMLHGGLALKALKAWGGDPATLVLLPGYCVRGTVGAMLIAGQRQIPLDGHATLNVKCRIRYMSFSAHADTTGIQQLIVNTQPRNVILVHGEKEGMAKLAAVIRRDFNIPVYTPATGQTISIPVVRRERVVPVYVHLNFLRAAVALTAAGGAPGQAACSAQQRQDLRALVASCTDGDDELKKLLVTSGFSSILGIDSDAPSEPISENGGDLSSSSSSSSPLSSFSSSSSPAAETALVPPGMLPCYFPFLTAPPAVCFKVSPFDSPSSEQSEANSRFLIVDHDTLQKAATHNALHGDGSLLHRLRHEPPFAVSAPSSSSSSPSSSSSSPSSSSSSSPASSSSSPAPLPKCLRLHSVRYSARVALSFASFRSLLGLFFEYFFQCRAAHQRQRLASAAFLRLPAALDFGGEVKVLSFRDGRQTTEDSAQATGDANAEKSQERRKKDGAGAGDEGKGQEEEAQEEGEEESGERVREDASARDLGAGETRNKEWNEEKADTDEDSVLVSFLSLVAVHDGRKTLRMQWADQDDQPNSAVFVFVEFFSSFDETKQRSEVAR